MSESVNSLSLSLPFFHFPFLSFSFLLSALPGVIRAILRVGGSGGVERGIRRRLIIRGFCLNGSHENIFCVVEIVLIKHAVFERGAVEPRGTLGFAEEATRVINI